MSKYLLLHTGFGSMVEGANAQMIVGPVTDANKERDRLYNFIQLNCDPDMAREMWFTTIDTNEAVDMVDAYTFLKDNYEE